MSEQKQEVNRKPKILLTYIESGMGHITSMKAIEDSMRKKYDDKYEIVSDYIMTHSKVTEKHEAFLTKQVQNTNKFNGLGKFIFGLIEIIGAQGLLRSMYRTVFKKTTDEVLRMYAEHDPDVIVSTHYALSHIAIEYQRRINPHCEVVTYNPDNNTHVWWDARQGWFMVNNEKAKTEAIKRRKFKEENIVSVNYTKRQALIEADLTKEQYREKYDLPKDKFTVIIADGVYAMGKSTKFARRLFRTKLPINIIFIAGKNEKVYKQMMKKKAKLEKKGRTNITLHVHGFEQNIHELYKASDVFITKAGPNSILDSLLMGTPVIVNFCPQPMEEAAYKHFVKKLRCGIAVFKPRKIRRVIESYIHDPSGLDEYVKNTHVISDSPNGADSIADFVDGLCEKDFLEVDQQ